MITWHRDAANYGDNWRVGNVTINTVVFFHRLHLNLLYGGAISRRKRNWRLEFKTWMTLFVFLFVLMLWGKAWISLLSLTEQTGFFSLDKAISLGEGNLWIQTNLTLLKDWSCVISCSWHRGWINTYTCSVFYLYSRICLVHLRYFLHIKMYKKIMKELSMTRN